MSDRGFSPENLWIRIPIGAGGGVTQWQLVLARGKAKQIKHLSEDVHTLTHTHTLESETWEGGSTFLLMLAARLFIYLFISNWHMALPALRQGKN